MTANTFPPLNQNKAYDKPSLFRPDALIREARRQKGLAAGKVPPVCVLDPDGDIVRFLCKTGKARRSQTWPCYHSELFTFSHDALEIGIVGCAVGAPYAVLVAEQMFATGCELLVSITSAGQITPAGPTPYFVIIERSVRDEGTSYHYCPPADFSDADPALVRCAEDALMMAQVLFHTGASWTTDAPFRETAIAIEAAKATGILCVEMEAAALYAFAATQRRRVICLAHVTNQMGLSGADFEKGEFNGAVEALKVIAAIAKQR